MPVDNAQQDGGGEADIDVLEGNLKSGKVGHFGLYKCWVRVCETANGSANSGCRSEKRVSKRRRLLEAVICRTYVFDIVLMP
jgi:hypothetical protein